MSPNNLGADPGRTLTESVSGTARYIVDASGILVFSMALVGAAVFSPAGARTIAFGVAISTSALWAAGFLPPLRPHRVPWQVATMFALLISPMVFGIPSTFSQFGTTGSITIVLAFTFPMRIAAPVATTAIGVNALLLANVPTAVERGALMPWWVPTIMLAAFAVGVVTLRREWEDDTHHIDTTHNLDRDTYARERQLLETTAARAAVDRRIHETVLNTLTEVAVADWADDADIRRACADDLARLDELPEFDARTPLSTVLAVAVDNVRTLSMHVELVVEDDPVLPSLQASILRDAVIEALRNVARHAQTDHARIEASGDQTVCVQIIDEGVGMHESWVPGLGTRIALRSSLAAMGGAASISPKTPSGSIVTINMPIGSLAQLPADRTALALEARKRSVPFWLGTSAMPIVGALVAIPIAAPLQPTSSVALALVAVSLTLIGLAFAMHTSVHIPMAAATAAALIGLLISITRTAEGCATSDSTYFVLIVAILATPMLARTWDNYVSTFTINLGFTAAALWVAIWSPAACGWIPFALIPIITMATSTVTIYWYNDTVFLRRLSAADQQWLRSYEDRITAARADAIAHAWRQIDQTTRGLLRGLASGELAPRSPAVRAAVEVEATLLRTRLKLTATNPSAIRELISHLTDEAIAVRTGLDCQVLNEVERLDPFPVPVVAALRVLVREATGEQVRVRGFDDDGESEDLVVSAAAQRWVRSLSMLGLPSADGATTKVGDCMLEVVRTDSSAISLLINRPRATTPVGS